MSAPYAPAEGFEVARKEDKCTQCKERDLLQNQVKCFKVADRKVTILLTVGYTSDEALSNAWYFCDNMLRSSDNALKYHIEVMQHCAKRMEDIEMLTRAPNALRQKWEESLGGR